MLFVSMLLNTKCFCPVWQQIFRMVRFQLLLYLKVYRTASSVQRGIWATSSGTHKRLVALMTGDTVR